MKTETPVCKTLVVVELKNGKELRIESFVETDKLIQKIIINESPGIGFRDIYGVFTLINLQEYVTIEFIPQEHPE